jgi:hypothetical protein
MAKKFEMRLSAGSFASLLLCVFAGSASGQVTNWNVIRGAVLNQEGVAVDGAEVCAWGTGPISGAVPCSKSTRDGRFSVGVFRADMYTVYATHFGKGYPQARWSFYGKLWMHAPKVKVQENAMTEPITVVVGPKAGRLVLTILDGDSNHRIVRGSVTLCRVGESKSCWGISTSFPQGRYEVLTPEVPFTIKFETWRGPIPQYHGGIPSGPSGEWVARKTFDDRGLPLEVMQVDLGTRKEITVRIK